MNLQIFFRNPFLVVSVLNHIFFVFQMIFPVKAYFMEKEGCWIYLFLTGKTNGCDQHFASCFGRENENPNIYSNEE